MPVTPAFCFAHARRGFFELADIEKNAREGKGKPVSPIALARSDEAEIIAFADRHHPTYRLQIHPESMLTERGQVLLVNFVRLARSS